jgi:hypothetical protein
LACLDTFDLAHKKSLLALDTSDLSTAESDVERANRRERCHRSLDTEDIIEKGNSQGGKKTQTKAKSTGRPSLPPVPLCLQASAYGTQSESVEGNGAVHDVEGISDVLILKDK